MDASCAIWSHQAPAALTTSGVEIVPDGVVTLQPSPEGAMAETRAFEVMSARWRRIPRTNA